MDPFTQVKSAEASANKAKFNTKSISNRGEFFLAHRVQNVPENSAKTWLHFKTDHALRREENNVEFLEGRFLDKKLPFLHKKKTEHSFELSLSIFCLLTVYF